MWPFFRLAVISAVALVLAVSGAQSTDLFASSYASIVGIYKWNSMDGPSPFITNGLVKPTGLTVGPDNKLYVCDQGTNEVKRYLLDGTGDGAFVSAGSGGLSLPEDLTFGADGKLYVVSRGSNQILRYNSDGTYDTEFSGGLSAPHGLAFGWNGNLYVSCDTDSSVRVWNPGTNTFQLFASGGEMNQPRGMCFANNILYVANYNAGTTGIIPVHSSSVQEPRIWGSILFYTTDVAIGSDGLVYAANYKNGVCSRTISPNGTAFTKLIPGYTFSPNNLIDRQGYITLNEVVPAADIKTTRSVGDGSPASIQAAIVTAAFDGFFYIGSTNPPSGIRVERAGHGLTAGMTADVQGTVSTSTNGERCIIASYASQQGTGSIAPLGLNNRAIGGGDWLYNPDTGSGQKGIAGASGLNNIGLLVRTWGKFTYVNNSTFTIDDGSGLNVKCIVSGVSLSEHSNGQFVVVTGISSCEKEDEELHRLFLVDGPENLSFPSAPTTPAVDVTLSTTRFANVYDVAEIGSTWLAVNVRNLTTTALPVSIMSTITDFDGKVVYTDERLTTINAGQINIDGVSPGLTKKGFYTLTVEVVERIHYRTWSRWMTFGVVRMHPTNTPFSASDYFGLWGAGREENGRTRLAKQIGAQWLRVNCGWEFVEKTKGTYKWVDSDEELRVADLLNLGIMFWGENTGPSWAWGPLELGYSWNPIADLTSWRNFCDARANRYAGRVPAWEVWNEFWNIPPTNMVDVHQIAMEEFRQSDPTAVVLSNPVSPWRIPYLQSFLAAGGANVLDAIADHPYAGRDEALMVGRCPEEITIEHTRNLRSLIDQHRPGMPIWWTEWGWPADDYDPDQPGEYLYGYFVSERNQANYCVRSHLIGLSEGVKKFFYFHMRSGGSGIEAEAIIRPQGIRPVLCAYNTMTWMLNGRQYVGQVTPASNIYAMAFSGQDFGVLAYWYGDRTERYGNLFVPLNSADIQIVDLMDNPLVPVSVAGGIQIPIDGGPRFIMSSVLDPQILLTAFESAVIVE